MAIVSPDSRFASNALPTQTPSDYGYAGLFGMKCICESHNMREYFPERGKINWKPLDDVMKRASSEAQKYAVMWFFQANERPAWCSHADYEQIAFAMVSRYKYTAKRGKWKTSRIFATSPPITSPKPLFRSQREPNAPTRPVRFSALPVSAFPLRFNLCKPFKRADALQYLDGVSTHTYIGPGESWSCSANPLYLQKLQDMAGNRPLWQTEQGYNWGHSSKQEHARYVVSQFLNGFGMGIANMRHNYFYPVHNGFEPWYLIEGGFRGGNAGTPNRQRSASAYERADERQLPRR